MATNYRLKNTLKALSNVNEAVYAAIKYMDDPTPSPNEEGFKNDIYAYKLGMEALIKTINTSAIALKNITYMANFDRYESGADDGAP